MSLEHIEVCLVIFSETSETGHVAFPENWSTTDLTQNDPVGSVKPEGVHSCFTQAHSHSVTVTVTDTESETRL